MDSSAIIDPATGRPLPPDAIVRILHITNKVHVYSLPRDAVSTTAGYAAASWTTDPRNHIFTARLRVLETSFTSSPSPATTTPKLPQPQDNNNNNNNNEDDEDAPQQLKVDILLEDPSTGSLFAAAPYAASAAVEPTTDSSRFFALRVRDPASGHKATLGVGFEERSEAFDFGVALQEAGRALGWAQPPAPGAGTAGVGAAGGGSGLSGGGGGNLLGGLGAGEEKRDLSLKEGETITVNLAGTRFGRRAGRSDSQGEKKEGEGQSLASFALPPPPPPSAREVRAQKRLSAQQLGFDDGQFGEFA
ncbi:uncharacterized protein B0H64DRAFT_224034 [Chaetomium fimeti]|uniref:NECAP PHear domain-containing protein n=1 Tax=Chaetomium fimeti TaxID=1854472 RepID=A0AAE0LPJ1_9PEZI|nr:hypothetical protein B0H64DRAFT_224034 [Chaetomium fimeti]